MKAALVFLAALPAIALAQTTCEPHGDHWHCPSGVPEPTFLPEEEPAATSAAQAVSSAISSVLESVASSAQATTSAPEASATHSEHDHEHEHEHEATATTCEPHNDHWHCPSGVSEPTQAPPQTTNAAEEASGTSSATTSEFTGAAVIGATSGGMVAVALGAVGALFV